MLSGFPSSPHVSSYFPPRRGVAVAEAEGTSAAATCHVVDVAVSPWVLREAQRHCSFQAQVVALGLEWLEQETGLRMVRERPWAALAPSVCRYYKGGTAAAASSTAADQGVLPFFIDEVGLENWWEIEGATPPTCAVPPFLASRTPHRPWSGSSSRPKSGSQPREGAVSRG